MLLGLVWRIVDSHVGSTGSSHRDLQWKLLFSIESSAGMSFSLTGSSKKLRSILRATAPAAGMKAIQAAVASTCRSTVRTTASRRRERGAHPRRSPARAAAARRDAQTVMPTTIFRRGGRARPTTSPPPRARRDRRHRSECRIDRHLAARATEQLPDRFLQNLAFQVPQRDVDRRDAWLA